VRGEGVYFLRKLEKISKIFSANIGENLKVIFSQNWREFDIYFLPKSEKAVFKFSKAGERYPHPPAR